MIKNHLVSIIIPVYNGELFILKAIKSCLNQTYKNIEIIVVDDGSTDNTRNLLNLFIENKQIIYIYQDNKDRSAARNTGIKVASGNYIQFLDADDWLDSNKISLQIDFFKNNPNIDATYGITYYHKMYEDKPYLKLYYDCKDAFNLRIWMTNIIPINSILFKFDKNLYFDESMRYLEDWKYIIDFYLKSNRIVPYYLAICHVLHHENNTSNSLLNMKKAAKKMLEIMLKQNITLNRGASKYQLIKITKELDGEYKKMIFKSFFDLEIWQAIFKLIKLKIFSKCKIYKD